MLRVAYLFERFPSFGQTFCYREVAELVRQGADLAVFSIRQPTGEPAEQWDRQVLARVTYLPGEEDLVKEIKCAMADGKVPTEAKRVLKEWDRRSDFLRLYQAVYVGLRLREAGIIHLHAHFAGMAARTAYWIRQFFGIGYSLTVHANDIFAPRDFAVSLPKIFGAADAIVTVSDFAVARLQEQFPESAAKVFRVYNGVDLAGFKHAQFKGSPPLILSIGRLIPKKGFSDLVRACGLLKARGESYTCEIIGEGPLQQNLADEIASAKLEHDVLLVGHKTQSEIADRLATASLFVLSCCTDANGDMDNLPTVIMEAMAAGLPVISTRIAGLPEMVETGVSGELVLPNDPAALAQAMQPFLSDPARARAYGARGLELAAARFSIRQSVARLSEILAGCA